MFVIIQRLLLATLVLLTLSSCSNSDDQKEKGRIEQTTDQIANEIETSIKTPLEKAELAKDIANKYNDKIKDMTDKQ